MLKRIVVTLPVLGLVMAAGTAFTQNKEGPKNPEPSKFYKLEFVVKEVDGGKVLNARSYWLTVAATGERGPASIRAGTRVPIQSAAQPGVVQQYVDVGVNLDCRSIAETERGLTLEVAADISSLPAEPAPTGATGAPPTVRQNRWNSWVFVPLKKPTLIFSSDDVASKRQLQLELTATPLT